MQNKIIPTIAGIAFVMSASVSEASRQPGEVVLQGKLVSYDADAKELSFYSNKVKKELTFKFDKPTGPTLRFNEETLSSEDYLAKRDTMLHQIVLIYQPISEFDEENTDYSGYVVRYVGAVDKAFHLKRLENQQSSKK
ncbi:hypothetical protein [Rubritalea marina]|uniref:hypothetical protein n=1 Tax=Rubritalea marina TaxID=361055 RepID=UPI000361BB7F|nr:hypothetical protein [Rubritalea marina]